MHQIKREAAINVIRNRIISNLALMNATIDGLCNAEGQVQQIGHQVYDDSLVLLHQCTRERVPEVPGQLRIEESPDSGV